jgi:SnoaL-like domain
VADNYWELNNLYGRYAELLNLGRVDEIGELFKYGRIANSGGEDRVGSEQVAALYRDSVVFGDKMPDTLLVTTNIQLAIDGDLASGKAYYSAVHEVDGAPKIVVAGRYNDKFRRIQGKWWFEERRMTVDLVGDLSTHLKHPVDESQG